MIKIGDSASFSKTITETDVYNFAGIVGDFNPAHINTQYSENSILGKRIAHGMLVGSFISTVLGMYLPGSGTIYLEQSLKFVKPVFLGDTIKATVNVSEIINKDKGIFKLATQVSNQDGLVVVDGFAVVKFSE